MAAVAAGSQAALTAVETAVAEREEVGDAETQTAVAMTVVGWQVAMVAEGAAKVAWVRANKVEVAVVVMAARLEAGMGTDFVDWVAVTALVEAAATEEAALGAEGTAVAVRVGAVTAVAVRVVAVTALVLRVVAVTVVVTQVVAMAVAALEVVEMAVEGRAVAARVAATEVATAAGVKLRKKATRTMPHPADEAEEVAAAATVAEEGTAVAVAAVVMVATACAVDAEQAVPSLQSVAGAAAWQ